MTRKILSGRTRFLLVDANTKLPDWYSILTHDNGMLKQAISFKAEFNLTAPSQPVAAPSRKIL